jgi:hypothetical protein
VVRVDPVWKLCRGDEGFARHAGDLTKKFIPAVRTSPRSLSDGVRKHLGYVALTVRVADSRREKTAAARAC